MSLSKNEGIKSSSDLLRGTILESLSDQHTGAVSADDEQLLKFHGLYQQDDRDLRSERRKQKLEKLFSFMIRVAVPGGTATPEQYLTIDRLADDHGNGTIRLTTRQAFQLHGIFKGHLPHLIQAIHGQLMTSLAACGDVNRNVMCEPGHDFSPVHREVHEITRAIQAHLLPRSKAYHQIWINQEKVLSTEDEEETIYGKTYLPRKFKIGVAVPPSNSVDVYSQDLGYIAVIEKGQLIGFNITAGGGLGTTHGNKKTYPRLGDELGFVPKEQAIAVAEAVVTTQRDYGDRSNRKHARLKYTIADRGVDWFRSEVEKRAGIQFESPREVAFGRVTDPYGWTRSTEGKHAFTLFIQNGRIADWGKLRMKTGLAAVAALNIGEFRLSANQNLMIADLDDSQKEAVKKILSEYGLDRQNHQSSLRLHSMACVSLPTCGLALAESERYLPDLVGQIEQVLAKLGLQDEPISIRMTGCPNGCARPFLGEIGLVGKAPGKYKLFLGADYLGRRLNSPYVETLKDDEILPTLEPLLESWAAERISGERFGDFALRKGWVEAFVPDLED